MTHDVSDFDDQVVKRSHQVPVLVDFWAPWCGPCRTLTPVLEQLEREAQGRWVLAKVNTEDFPDLAQAFGISSIPNVKLFSQGDVVDEFVGALPIAEIRRWLDRVLPSPNAQLVAEAEDLVQQGEAAAAARLLEPVLVNEPHNAQARLVLAEAQLRLAPARVREILEPVDAASEFATRAEALRALARVALLADRPAALPEAPVREDFQAGARAIQRGDYAAALEAFIRVIERRRDYADGAACDAGKAIFQLLGHRHPVAERYHRAFTSALYS